MTIDEVVASGTTKMRLPNWAPTEVGEVYINPKSGKLGPWFIITGAMGETKVFIGVADKYKTYEPVFNAEKSQVGK